MSFEEANFKPDVGEDIIKMPLTFSTSPGGRKQYAKSKLLWGGVALAGVIAYFIWVISNDKGFLEKGILAVVGLIGGYLLISYGIMKEREYQRELSRLIENDYRFELKNFWGIFRIEDEYPYFVHFKDGKTGVFILLEKDVIVGKNETDEYEHFENISNAYRLASESEINFAHLDFMDSVGNDPRLNKSFMEAAKYPNEDLRDVIITMLTSLQEDMSQEVTTHDIYVFHSRISSEQFWYRVKLVINELMKANYTKYRILTESDLRDVAKSIFNLHDFSAVAASKEVFSSSASAGIVPLYLRSPSGEVNKLGNTIAEKKALAEQKRLQEAALRKEKDRRKVRKGVNKHSDEEDLFG